MIGAEIVVEWAGARVMLMRQIGVELTRAEARS